MLCGKFALKELEDNYTNNVFNAGADSKLVSYLNVRASCWKRFSLPKSTYYWQTMIAILIVRHFSFLANEPKLNSGPSLKWKCNFTAHVYPILKLLITNELPKCCYFSPKAGLGTTVTLIFLEFKFIVYCAILFSFLTFWLRNSVDFRSFRWSCSFSAASLVGEFQWSAKLPVLIIPTRCSAPCNRRLRQFSYIFVPNRNNNG